MLQKITVKDLYKKLKDKKNNFICIDVRMESEYDNEHISNTINIPVDQLKNNVSELKKYDEIYLQCAKGSRSQRACGILTECGFDNHYSVEGGLNAWKAEELPIVENKKPHIPIMRQVFIAAGSVILAGLVFKVLFENDTFLILPFSVSIGLVYAGFGGNCLMTKLLIKASWNR